MVNVLDDVDVDGDVLYIHSGTHTHTHAVGIAMRVHGRSEKGEGVRGEMGAENFYV